MDLIGFALAVLLIELTPGPNMGWLVMLTLSEASVRASPRSPGLPLGWPPTPRVIAASYILGQSAALAQSMSLLGAMMMAFLAWQAWRESGESSPVLTPRRAVHRHALAGFNINLLNPKAALFFVTVMPQFVPGGRPTYAEGLAMAAISVAIATTIHLALIVGAERARVLVMLDGRAQAVRRVLAIGMLGVAAWFLSKALL